MKHLVPKIEGILRGVCFLWHVIVICPLLGVEVFLRPYWSKVDQKCGGFFSQNFKRRAPFEYLYILFERGLLAIFGITYVVEYKVK
jgi:hypothetical protein